MRINKLKRNARNWLLKVPGLGAGIVDGYRRAALLKRIVYVKLNASRGPSLPDPETVYWIDPMRIRLHTNFTGNGTNGDPADRVFDPAKDKGKVRGGDWDLSRYAFRDLAVFRALEDVILEQKPWSQTDFYRDLSENIGRGDNPWNLNSAEELDARCKYLDELITSIRNEGYRPAHQVLLDGEEKSLKQHQRYGSEISVNIGRNGQYLFQDGRHRLAIAQILRLKEVPVKVLVRHRKWVEFRSYVKSLAVSGGGASRHAKLYQDPTHPDLKDIPSAHGCVDRMDAIRAHLKPDSGNALDIGANLGYFCHGLEELGYRCTAVEYLPQIAQAAERIRDAEDKAFRVLAMDLFAATERHSLQEQEFDVVLALNIFHHFLKKEETFDKFKHWLNNMQISQMFFEAHCVEEEQMQSAFRNYDESEFVSFLLENSQLREHEMIHRCDDGRALFRLWR